MDRSRSNAIKSTDISVELSGVTMIYQRKNAGHQKIISVDKSVTGCHEGMCKESNAATY